MGITRLCVGFENPCWNHCYRNNLLITPIIHTVLPLPPKDPFPTRCGALCTPPCADLLANRSAQGHLIILVLCKAPLSTQCRALCTPPFPVLFDNSSMHSVVHVSLIHTVRCTVDGRTLARPCYAPCAHKDPLSTHPHAQPCSPTVLHKGT